MKRAIVMLVLGGLVMQYAVCSAEPYKLKPRFRENQSWSFEQTGEMQQTSTMSVPGQPAGQPIEQRLHQTRKGTVTVLAVRDGVPTSIRVQFDPSCGGKMEMGGQQQAVPFAFAGQQVTLTRDARGQVQHDAKGQADPMAVAELTGYYPTADSYPSGPVAVGDQWRPDVAPLRAANQLGPGDRAEALSQLVSVQPTGGGAGVAEIRTTVTFTKRQDAMEMQTDMTVTSHVAMDTGLITQAESTGASTMRGTQQMPDYSGQATTVQVNGQGRSGMRLTVRELSAGRGVPVTDPDASAADVRAVGPRDLAGQYVGDRLAMTLAGTAGRYTGEIRMGTQPFPVTARAVGDRLEGTFQSGADRFDFTATLRDATLTLTTGGTTYALQKQGLNPLDSGRPAVNPLAGPRSDAGDGRAVTPPVAPAASGQVVRYRRVSVQDQPNMIGGEAFSFLCPVDWKMEGGMVWRDHPAMPATVHLRIFNPKGLEQLESFPTLGFNWGGLLTPEMGFPVGANYMGNEVRPPVQSAMQYLKEIIVPRYRADVQARLIGEQELPEWAKAVSQQAEQVPGVQVQSHAGKIRLAYTVQGQPVEEDLYCVLQTVFLQAAGNMCIQTGERVHGIRAASGRLDESTRVMQAMVTSVRVNPQWFNQYQQVCQALHNMQMQKIRTAGQISRIISESNREISDMMHESWQRRQESEDRIARKWTQAFRGVETYYNPIDQRPVELPSGYRHAWVSGNGEVVLTDQANFNPNVELGGSWESMERHE